LRKCLERIEDIFCAMGLDEIKREKLRKEGEIRKRISKGMLRKERRKKFDFDF